MRVELLPHPLYGRGVVTAIAVTISRNGNALELRYDVSGQIGALAMPPRALPARADELWRHTCFEAFLARGAGYDEFNFSPSTAWAAYRFDGYRTGMKNLETPAPAIRMEANGALTLTVSCVAADALKLGLSAVIEEKTGDKTYWALAHPAETPDFHHPGGFAIDLGTL